MKNLFKIYILLLFSLSCINSFSQCRKNSFIGSLSCGYSNGFTMSVEAGLWQVGKPLMGTVGIMAYDVEKSVVINDKNEVYKDIRIDPFLRTGIKLNYEQPLFFVVSGFASLKGIVGVSGNVFYRVGPVTLAGIQLGQSNKGHIAKAEILFTF